MRRKTVLVLFLLAVLLATPWASAAPRHGGGRPAGASGVGVIPDVLGQAWSYLMGVWRKEGCHIDPNGRCITTPTLSSNPLSSTDAGCNIDPNGGLCGL
jgi:hypothetical protein